MPPISIVIIDDHAAFSTSVEYFLKVHSQLTVVATASDGELGLAQAQRLRPDITLIDLELAGSTGLETIRRLRASLPAMGIIALSLGDQDVYRQAALGAGADDFVSKIRIIEELTAIIQHVGQARQSLQRPAAEQGEHASPDSHTAPAVPDGPSRWAPVQSQ